MARIVPMAHGCNPETAGRNDNWPIDGCGDGRADAHFAARDVYPISVQYLSNVRLISVQYLSGSNECVKIGIVRAIGLCNWEIGKKGNREIRKYGNTEIGNRK